MPNAVESSASAFETARRETDLSAASPCDIPKLRPNVSSTYIHGSEFTRRSTLPTSLGNVSSTYIHGKGFTRRGTVPTTPSQNDYELLSHLKRASTFQPSGADDSALPKEHSSKRTSFTPYNSTINWARSMLHKDTPSSLTPSEGSDASTSPPFGTVGLKDGFARFPKFVDLQALTPATSSMQSTAKPRTTKQSSHGGDELTHAERVQRRTLFKNWGLSQISQGV
jgi:hypothetical protein